MGRTSRLDFLPMRIYLIGFMGAGKTAVGRCLARRLGVPFVDLDAEIEARAALEVPEIFARFGEAGFRRRETSALESTGELPAAVVATGGGILTAAANREWLERHGVTVWLNPDFSTMARRLDAAARARRPLFADEGEARRLWRQRLPLYRGCEVEVPVAEGETVEQTTDRVARALAEATCAT